MAKKDKQDLSFINPVVNKKLIQNIQNNIDTSYNNTYYTDNNDSKYIDAIRRRMDADLNSMMDKSKMRNNGNSMSKLYSRTLADTDEGAIREFKAALQDETMLSDLMDMYSQNAIQRDLDREIDVVCKYVPKLEKALKIKMDHVLCADHFNKNNLTYNILTNETGKNAQDSSNDTASQYASKSDIESFRKKYDLDNKFKVFYDKTAKYGEEFIYIISYNKAMKRLLTKNATSKAGLLSEDGILNESDLESFMESNCKKITFVYSENFVTEESHIDKSTVDTFLSENCCVMEDIDDPSTEYTINNMLESEESKFGKLEVEFNDSGVIPSVLLEISQAKRISKITEAINEADTLASSGTYLSNSSYLKNMNKEFEKFAKGGTLKSPDKLAIDGFVDMKKSNETDKKIESINIPGCIVRELDHTMVKILAMKDNNTKLGYYYIECNRDLDRDPQTTFSSTLGGLRPRRSTKNREDMNRPDIDDQILAKIARQISQKIDAEFVNANQDIANEIYTILKYNNDHGDGKVNKIRVSFIPPDDIIHIHFDLNEKTHRGKSDLLKSLFPAKLLSCMYISNVIALLTRGYDKRAYYVRNSADTNISKVLLNVINQIKQSNFNLRQIENMNNIMNITGRFNDLVIPRNMNGESPVDFEVIPGQNIEIKTEFMQMLEDIAVSMIMAPELVNSRDNEQTATHITMTNTQFLIDIFERQQKYKDIISEIATKIYQNEYGTNDEIEIELPPPMMLNFSNISQMLSVANDIIQNITVMKLGANQMDEALKAEFTGKLMEYYFKTFLPMEDINKLYDEAKVELAKERQEDQSQMMGAMGGAPEGGDMGGEQPQM